MLVEFGFCAVGLVLLTFAADHLVLGSSRLAARLRVNPVVVGVVVIGLGTSAPEFLVSGLAAARGDVGIALGNLVGSNILNLTLILGVAALVGAVGVSGTVVAREVPLAVAASVVFGVVSALVLAVLMVAALVLLLRWARAGRDRELVAEVAEFTEEPAAGLGSRPLWVEGTRAAAGLVGVLAGAQLLVVNASAVAGRFGVPQVVIGFTLVALGTSLPELVTTVQAQRRGESELVVGNLFGSNLFNSLAGGAVVGFAAGAGSGARASAVLVVAMVLTGLLAWALLRRGLRLSRVEGLVLLGAYVVMVPLLLSV